MNVVVLRGRLSSASTRRTLSSGSELLSLELITSTEAGQISVPVAWFDPPADADPAVGEELLIRGVVRRRFFRTAAGTQSRTEVVAAGDRPGRPTSAGGEAHGDSGRRARRPHRPCQPSVLTLFSSANDSLSRSTKLTSPARSQMRGS